MANEKRLIDANALKRKFDEREADDIDLYGVRIIECFPADDAKEIVDQMPTVDAVEVVRCKGCVYGKLDKAAYYHDVYGNENDTTLYHCLYGFGRNKGEHFCSYGERREGE